jgi:hypothetical protein
MERSMEEVNNSTTSNTEEELFKSKAEKLVQNIMKNYNDLYDSYRRVDSEIDPKVIDYMFEELKKVHDKTKKSFQTEEKGNTFSWSGLKKK